MITALDLFAARGMAAQRAVDALTPPSVAVDTSELAAEAIRPYRQRIYDIVVTYVTACGVRGATAQEIERGTGFGGSTTRPRLCEATLTGGPLVRCADTRKTTSGRQAHIYRAKAFGPKET